MTLAESRHSTLPVVWMAIAFTLLIAVSCASYALTSMRMSTTNWVEHTHTVVETVATLSGHLAEARRAERGYLLTGAGVELAPYGAAVRAIQSDLQQLRALTVDNPQQQQRLVRLAPHVRLFVDHTASANATRRTHPIDSEQAIEIIRSGDVYMSQIAPLLTELLDEERRLLSIRGEAMASSEASSRVIQIVGTALSFVLLALAFAGLRREIRQRVDAGIALRHSEVATRELNNDLENRVATRTTELETSNRELEAFSYSVAHDLRAPLRALSGFSEILIEDYSSKLDPDGIDALAEVRDNARKMGTLIDAMLSLSRVTRIELRSEIVDLAAIVRAAVIKLQLVQPRPRLEVIIGDNVLASLAPELAQTLVKELVENAWKFTSKIAMPRIEFGATDIDGHRTFFVRDNGAGFDAAHVAKLFVPFHRLHTVIEFPGTGIGLSTVQRIVGRYGGRIWAAGQVDVGATFYFTLPNS